MDILELRNLQAPLKEKYRTDPGSALVTLSAQGKVGADISCKVETWQGVVEAGLHPATGGNGMLACSGDMMLQALVACAGVTIGAVATAIGIIIKSGDIKAEGDLDFRGTLGVSKNVPVGFQNIRLIFDLEFEDGTNDEKKETLFRLTERYCVVYQTLTRGVNVKVEAR